MSARFPFSFNTLFSVMGENVPYGIFALCFFTGYSRLFLLISQKPEDDNDPIDALSGDFDSCPAPKETSNTAEVLCFFIWTFWVCLEL